MVSARPTAFLSEFSFFRDFVTPFRAFPCLTAKNPSSVAGVSKNSTIPVPLAYDVERGLTRHASCANWTCAPRRGVRSSSEGRSPGKNVGYNAIRRANGPIILLGGKNDWPVGPAKSLALPPVFQGCALRWINCWAFGPNGFLCFSSRPWWAGDRLRLLGVLYLLVELPGLGPHGKGPVGFQDFLQKGLGFPISIAVVKDMGPISSRVGIQFSASRQVVGDARPPGSYRCISYGSYRRIRCRRSKRRVCCQRRELLLVEYLVVPLLQPRDPGTESQ